MTPNAINRRQFVQGLGAGLLVTVVAGPKVVAQERPRRGGGGGGFRGGGAVKIAARVHIAADGTITVMSGKVECGQGARAEITQAAAEELRVAAERVQLILADTGLVPDDGMTAGSRTTPSTIPAVREGCAAAREALLGLAAKLWGVQRSELEAHDGKVVHAPSTRAISYGELAAGEGAAEAFGQVPANVTLTAVKDWKVLGTPVARPNRRDLVTGGHKYPSDVSRPGMLYGRVLRPPAYGAKLKDVDLAPAKAMAGVVVVQDGDFVGVAAPTRFAAGRAVDAIAKTAKWDVPEGAVSSDVLYEHLRNNAPAEKLKNPFADDVAKAAKSLKQAYHVAYVQHAPMEPRAAVAEWDKDGKLTVWTGTQNPFGVRGELSRSLNLPAEQVRVIVPDFGGGFGGKHSGEAAVEAAKLARAAGKPVSLRWTRAEEFTWAYFRPAGVIEAEASLDDAGKLTSWYFVNVNSGGSGIDTPYRVAKKQTPAVQSRPPLKGGSYRGLASTANTFARECFIDELAALAGMDPLAFRLAHLDDGRLRDVLVAVAKRFDWETKSKARREPGSGVGVACGTEKGAFVAACAEVTVDAASGKVTVNKVCQVFECGAVMNPANLLSQNQGAILMGLGPALREAIQFKEGRVTNASFGEYRVTRFADVPAELDVQLLDRPDLPSSGAGETPIIAVAPAVANAAFMATGTRVRAMPFGVRAKETAAHG